MQEFVYLTLLKCVFSYYAGANSTECDHICSLESAVKQVPVNFLSATCSGSSTFAPNEALLQTCCGIGDKSGWKQGEKVKLSVKPQLFEDNCTLNYLYLIYFLKKVRRANSVKLLKFVVQPFLHFMIIYIISENVLSYVCICFV
jgi:hypothetical protein